jgi:predicted O-methyltransferase YrrM
MPPVGSTLKDVARYGRRVQGRLRVRKLEVTGRAPTAVRDALHAATAGRPSADERAWISRIELLRRLLAASPQPLEIVDFGAGKGHRFDGDESPTGHTISRTLGEMTRSSKPPRWAYLLFRIVRALQPTSVLELGACVGISASYQSAALELNGDGRLVSLEGAPVLAARSRRSLEELGLAHRATVVEGRFADTLDGAISELRPIEMAFIDGHHVEDATIDYMERILAAVADEAVLVFDDIHWSPGMTSAWRTIEADPRFALALDLGTLGITAVSASAASRTTDALPFA